MTATFSDIESAVEFVSSGDGMSEAYVDIQTGAIFYVDDVVEEEVPEDLYENSRYISLPGKYDLGLDKNTAIQFVAENLPAQLELAYEIFSKKGAYRRFKDFLNASDKLEAWYSYEERALRDAIIEWCQENNVPFSEAV
ncbi:hypothetical protein MAQ5080_01352 [Marinomonas aquimarina]|uniref:Uncharacterized protein n=1 Tax=Marinomonas aquimarina TaxID=295068 RepID=A0A1A8TB25_9GAMM|nr:UPF0158 family protein [Marinomonas aquimarina]SBS29301.1 hypothetical protein MAQ5080_01352 [Marinomonas aquimarina]